MKGGNVQLILQPHSAGTWECQPCQIDEDKSEPQRGQDEGGLKPLLQNENGKQPMGQETSRTEWKLDDGPVHQ